MQGVNTLTSSMSKKYDSYNFYRNIGTNTVMNGYQIPEGTLIYRIGFLSSNDPKYFKQADMFLPERWIRGN